MLRLLLVEDDRNCSIPTSIYLKHVGHYVDCASNGKEALDWIQANGEPDVILLDLFMPVMSGYQFLETYVGSAPVIILSGWTDAEQKIPGSPVALVRKPFNRSDLGNAISLATEKRRKEAF